MTWWLEAFAAATPIVVILVAMVFFKKSAALAGSIGFVVTAALVTLVFGFPTLAETMAESMAETGIAADSFAVLWRGMVGSVSEAGFTAATILWIIFGALCLHQLQMITGAIESLREAIGALSDDPRVVAILIAWFFTLFIEGAAGFGTPIALAAPFLVGFGFRPLEAVTIALVGHSVGVSFGAVGTPVMPQIAVTEFTGPEIARVTGEFHAVLGAIMLAIVLVIVTRRARKEGKELARIGGWFALAAASFLVPMWAISRWVGPELPTMGGAVIGAIIFIGALRLQGGTPQKNAPQKNASQNDTNETSTSDGPSLLQAVSPYAVVIGLILFTRLIPPVQSALQSVEWSWQFFGIFSGSFAPLYHPGTILVLGFLMGGLFQGATKAQLKEALQKALKMLVPVTIALVAMLAISRLMVHGHMIDVLAGAAASTAGQGWPVLAPFVGVLGTFVTGSATASNILFTDFQIATAHQLELDGLRLVGAQGFGAAVGNIVCPHNIIAGCATVGIAGQEGDVLRRTLGACAIYALLGGVMVWFLV